MHLNGSLPAKQLDLEKMNIILYATPNLYGMFRHAAVSQNANFINSILYF